MFTQPYQNCIPLAGSAKKATRHLQIGVFLPQELLRAGEYPQREGRGDRPASGGGREVGAATAAAVQYHQEVEGKG